MLVFFILEGFIFFGLYLLSRGKYKVVLSTIEAKQYSMQVIMPATLFLLDFFNYRYSTKYDRRIAKRLANLHGAKSLELHRKLYYSSKMAIMLATLMIMTFFGVMSKEVEVGYISFTLAVPFLIFYLFDKDLERKEKKKYDSIRADFPELVSKLVLLVNAGMNMNRAWEKICTESKKKTPLYEELRTTYMQILGGKPEGEAYEEFARRCKVKEITKFVTLVIQNLKKGSGDVVPLLKLQAEECWELRKMRAKQLGEEASAKLILPMMIMFIGILIIVVLPAVLQLSSL